MSSTKQISRAVRRTLMLSAAAAASLPAMAQVPPAPEGAGVETIVITGSRIPQPQLESVSPVTSVGAESIQQSGVTKVEDLLNTLPQVAAQFGSHDSNGATGEATVSLRNLGANRTLVLVNGRRLMPGDPTLNGNAAPDLNQIPASLVERVDLLTGGASAVYGADAVAGVVNFVMNDHFQGVRFEGNYNFYNHDNRDKNAQGANTLFGFTAPSGNATDGYARDFAVIAGANFADGRGNATGYAGYRRVAALLQAKRDYSNCSLTSTSTAGGASALGCGGSTTSYVARFNVAGNPTQHLNPATGDIASGSPPLYNFAPLNYYQRPDERYTAGAFVHYDVNDHARVYTELMFMDDRSIAQIAPSGAFPGVGPGATATGVPDGTFLINCNNPYLTATELTDWCAGSTTNPDVHVALRRRNVEGGPRYDDLGHTSYRAVFGVKGDITEVWSYDSYALWGTTRYSEEYFNDVSKTRMAFALDAVTNASGQIICRANSLGTVAAPGCVPWNIFSFIGGGVSQAAVKYISIPGESKGSTTERVVDGAVTGDLGKMGVKLPTARDGLGVSIGAEYRQESSELQPDLTFQTDDLAGQGAPTLPTLGSLHVAEVFAEARLPLVEDRPLAKSLTLETGYRYSDYNLAFGSTNTYKAGLQWTPISDLRLRSMYQRAVRAPNIQELFLQPRVALDTTFNNDLCAGAAPVDTAAQCANSGVTAAEYGHIPKNPAGQYNGLLGGNGGLAPEKADTYTIGLILTPRFLPDFNLTLDYFNIGIKNLISQYGGNLILTSCLASGDPLFCSKVHRTQGTATVADGSLWINTSGYISDTNFNLGSQHTNGVDLTSQYRFDFGRGGKVGLDLVGTYLLKASTEPVTGLGSYDCAGFYGATCGVPAPRWRHKLRATWNTPLRGLDMYTAWRRTNGVDLEFLNSSPLLKGTLGLPIAPGQHLKGMDYIDLGGSYTFLGHVTMRLGVNNLFDKSPPLVALQYIGGVFGNGNTYPNVYDAVGRYVFFNMIADF